MTTCCGAQQRGLNRFPIDEFPKDMMQCVNVLVNHGDGTIFTLYEAISVKQGASSCQGSLRSRLSVKVFGYEISQHKIKAAYV